MSVSGFTPGQRRIVLVMASAVTFAFATLAGLVVTSTGGRQNATPMEVVPPASSLPTLDPTPLPTPTPILPETDIWSQVQAARLFDQVGRQVETLRGLTPRAGVPLSFLADREMEAFLRGLHANRQPEPGMLSYEALGLVPDVPVPVGTYKVSSVYVPEHEQVYVLTGRQESSVDAQMLLAHAYVHALQDQHFDLEAIDARAKTTDAALAIRALVEGDAMLLTSLYGHGAAEVADPEALRELTLRAEQARFGADLDTAEGWARLRRFPYWEGRQFADIIFQSGGWQALNRAYVDPPSSTEQVLHPDRYLGERDVPISIVVPDAGSALGEGWELALQDTLGELVIGLYLDAWLTEERAWRAAEGWDGDTFVVWEQDDGARVMIWRTIWDNTGEAEEFEHALAALVPHHYAPAWRMDPPHGLAGGWWEAAGGGVAVWRVARYVSLVVAPDLPALLRVAEVIP